MRGWEGRKEEKLYRRQESLKIRPFPGEPLASLSSLFLPFFSSSLPPSASPRFARKVKPPLPLPFPDEASNDGPRCVLTAAKSSRKYLRSYSFPPRFLTGRQRLEVIPSIPIRQAGRFPPRMEGRMLLSPYCRTRAPRGSPFNTPKCPIYNVVVALPRSVAIFFSSFEDKRCGRFSLTTSSIARREEREFCLKFVSFEKMIRSREKIFFEADRLCKCEMT